MRGKQFEDPTKLAKWESEGPRPQTARAKTKMGTTTLLLLASAVR